MSNDKTCTCPSGDGSLRHPCPAHPATLATVKHGECVQLATPNRARFEAWAHAQSYRGGNIMADRDSVYPDVYADPIAQLTWKSWQAALSAQPSPGGQGNRMLEIARRNIRSYIQIASFPTEADRSAAGLCVDVLEEAIAARQPVCATVKGVEHGGE